MHRIMHQRQWDLLMRAFQHHRLPHAVLLIGKSGIGKKYFAEQFAQHVLCNKHTACGECKSCRLIQADTHPDLIRIGPEESGQMIKIDQIRALIDIANTTSLLGGYRIILIHPASAMNHASANALLKTLEEPTPN